MDRQQLKTSDEDLVAEFGRILNLFARALRTRSDAVTFCQRVNKGAELGFTWVEALERAADKRDPIATLYSGSRLPDELLRLS